MRPTHLASRCPSDPAVAVFGCLCGGEGTQAQVVVCPLLCAARRTAPPRIFQLHYLRRRRARTAPGLRDGPRGSARGAAGAARAAAPGARASRRRRRARVPTAPRVRPVRPTRAVRAAPRRGPPTTIVLYTTTPPRGRSVKIRACAALVRDEPRRRVDGHDRHPRAARHARTRRQQHPSQAVRIRPAPASRAMLDVVARMPPGGPVSGECPGPPVASRAHGHARTARRAHSAGRDSRHRTAAPPTRPGAHTHHSRAAVPLFTKGNSVATGGRGGGRGERPSPLRAPRARRAAVAGGPLLYGSADRLSRRSLCCCPHSAPARG